VPEGRPVVIELVILNAALSIEEKKSARVQPAFMKIPNQM
jgi:hypothetical protein